MQVYRTAVPPTLAFDQWTHVKIDITGNVAKIYLNDEHDPTLTVPRLAGVDGGAIGVWTGYFGRGAYYSNIRYAARPPSTPAPDPPLPSGTIANWELSESFDAPAYLPLKQGANEVVLAVTDFTAGWGFWARLEP